MNRYVRSLIALSLLLLSTPLYGQDSITGIYTLFSSPYNEIILQVNGQFKFRQERMNNGRAFHGTWTGINDSTIKAHTDTIVTEWFNKRLLSEFYCIQSKDTRLIWCHFHYVDTVEKDTGEFKLWFRKEAAFHSTGELRQEVKKFLYGTIITTYHPNGRVKDVVEYNEDGVKNGLYLEYGTDGRLIMYQLWRKGKLKKETNWKRFYGE